MSNVRASSTLAILSWVVCFALAGHSTGVGQTSRLVVNKPWAQSPQLGSQTPPFAPIVSVLPDQLGYVLVAEYPTRILFEGPAKAATALISALAKQGYTAEIATDVDELPFLGHTIDPDSGVASPPFPASADQLSAVDGLYLIALRGYPTPSWLDDLEARNIRLIESLSAASYLVRGPRSVVASLKGQVSYVRAVIPVMSGMKIPATAGNDDSSTFRRFYVQAVEETPQDNIQEHLASVSSEPVVVDVRQANGRVGYVASLSDLDLQSLALFENIYSILEVPPSAPSTERQGMLALQPTTTSPLLLPAPLTTTPGPTYDYWDQIQAKGIPGFSNTTVAILDTGFDDGTNTHPDFQLGGPSIQTLLTEWATQPAPGRYADMALGHGTVTASIITGYTAFNVRADSDKYRFGLGMAPGVKVISDKFFESSQYVCGGGNASLAAALDRVKNYLPTLVNLSWNDFLTGSNGYTADSLTVDQRSRTYGYLFTIAAGNVPDYCPTGHTCSPSAYSYVRGPATAKNAIAVGATENFTPQWSTTATSPATCLWNGSPNLHSATWDARNVPSYSAAKEPVSMVKPDLVAPGSRITGPISRGFGFCPGSSIFCVSSVASFTSPDVTYSMSAGTSFAAPAVAGAAAVVGKWYQNLTGNAYPSPAMSKAILINGARDVGAAPSGLPCAAGTAAVRAQDFTQTACIGHIPDAYQGWGMLNLTRLLGSASDYYFNDQNQHQWLTPASTYWQTTMTVNDGTRPVRITLVYSDASGNTAGLSPYKVANDLQLGAFKTACFPCWAGNNFSVSSGLSVANSLTNDTVNNVEEIIIPASYYPSGTVLTVFVQAINLVADAIFGGPHPQQDFALFAENAH